MTRKLATIRKIDSIHPIEGADAIQRAVVGGWNVVVKRNEFIPGELAAFIEIDSWVPNEIAPFLTKGSEPKEYNQVRGERLRTVKLRGVVSQGLLLKLDTVDNAALCYNGIQFPCIEGLDISSELGIQKWEAPIPAQLSGQVRGLFPSFIPKTDQNRIQNLTEEFFQWKDNPYFKFEVTEKLDGSSMTVYVNDDDAGVCSRNLSMKLEDCNTYSLVAKSQNLIEKIRSTGRNLALQGELIGEGIQKNPYGIRGHDFLVFDIYDIDARQYLNPEDRRILAEQIGVGHVPVILDRHDITETVQELLKYAEGKSELSQKAEREGFVFKCIADPSIHFKVISNRLLMRGGD